MRTNTTKFFGVFLAVLAIGASSSVLGSRRNSRAGDSRNAPVSSESRSRTGSLPAADTTGSAPLRFIPNGEPSVAHTKFVARGAAQDVSLKAGVAVVELASAGPRKDVHKLRKAEKIKVRVALAGSNPAPTETREDSYTRVRFDEVYPGIDLVYHGNQQELEYDFVVAPRADPRKIIVKLDGIDGMRLNEDGNIVLRAGEREIVQHKPFVYQEINGVRREVGSGFVLLSDNQVGFELSSYDKNRELVIDPVLVYGSR